MIGPPTASILLVCNDARWLMRLATELSALGCRVLCARDLEHAMALVRAGLTTRFVLVFLGADRFSPADLRAAMAARLPGWMVQADDLDEPVRGGSTVHRIVN